MITTSSQESEAVFTSFVRNWFRLLSRGEWAKAVEQLDEPNSYGIAWGEKEIRDALLEYGNSVISDPDTVPGDGRPSLRAFTDLSGYSFWHDVPIDGKWGDLVAQFEFLNRPSGFAVVLHDMHVT